MAAYRQAHWNVLGMDFEQLHGMFEGLAAETRDQVELVAERDERLLLQELVQRTEQLAGGLRRAMDDQGDAATVRR